MEFRVQAGSSAGYDAERGTDDCEVGTGPSADQSDAGSNFTTNDADRLRSEAERSDTRRGSGGNFT